MKTLLDEIRDLGFMERPSLEGDICYRVGADGTVYLTASIFGHLREITVGPSDLCEGAERLIVWAVECWASTPMDQGQFFIPVKANNLRPSRKAAIAQLEQRREAEQAELQAKVELDRLAKAAALAWRSAATPKGLREMETPKVATKSQVVFSRRPIQSSRDTWKWLETKPLSSVASPETVTSQNDARRHLSQALLKLRAREERVLRLRYGLGLAEPHTLVEIAGQFSVQPERIRQIEAKALRKLKHPSVMVLIRPLHSELSSYG